MNRQRLKISMISLLAGALAVAGFAPFQLFPAVILALVLLFRQWQHAGRREAAWLGFLFGLAFFGAGTGWIGIALHEFGGMPLALSILATVLFAAFLALFPALCGFLQASVHGPAWVRKVMVMPALWVLLEWIRGLVFTGFPWLSIGYSQVAPSPLAGYAPLLGVYGVSLAVAVSAGLLAELWQVHWKKQGRVAWVALILLWGGGALGRAVEWTTPAGDPFKVALVQGNISQKVKFNETHLNTTLETYRRLVLGSDARLVVLPETALPVLLGQLPDDYTATLASHVRQQNGDLLIGGFERDRGLIYNSVYTLGTSDSQSYRKNHLVPFGEFIPLRPVLGWLINEVLDIPMSDLARGGERQPLLHVAGQRVAVQICYEDVFGEEVIRYLPEATLLVNVSNDAWYGKSHAAMQHNQIAQMRALETGRMMLRATNTGVTSVIGPDGRVRAMLPQHEEGVLAAPVQGYVGSTPYVRVGNLAVVAMLMGMLGYVRHARRKERLRTGIPE